MKKCPQCGTQYSDVTLSFCLHDGTPLIVEPAGDTPTVVLGETATRVRVPVGDQASDAWGKSQVTQVAAPVEKKGSNTALVATIAIVGVLLLFGIIGIAAILLLRGPERVYVANNTNLRPNTNVVLASTPYVTASPMRMPSPMANVEPSPDKPPSVLSSYPATKRLVFARGAYSTSFSGDINPGDTRSLVLGCRSGQSLSANISGSSCVNIRGGGSSFRTTTSGGDNYVTIASTCSTVAHFTVTISVI
jgi:hypothetical protein